MRERRILLALLAACFVRLCTAERISVLGTHFDDWPLFQSVSPEADRVLNGYLALHRRARDARDPHRFPALVFGLNDAACVSSAGHGEPTSPETAAGVGDLGALLDAAASAFWMAVISGRALFIDVDLADRALQVQLADFWAPRALDWTPPAWLRQWSPADGRTPAVHPLLDLRGRSFADLDSKYVSEWEQAVVAAPTEVIRVAFSANWTPQLLHALAGGGGSGDGSGGHGGMWRLLQRLGSHQCGAECAGS